MSDDISNKYIEYAEMLNDLTSAEMKLQNIRRVIDDIRTGIISDENDGSCGLDFTAHAFKQLSERLERLAMENTLIYNDVFGKENKSEYLLSPSNLKCFIITILADAHKKKNYTKEKSKNSDGFEFRFIIDIKKWSQEKTLQLVCIIENNVIKTGYFNWI